ncbi:hypothetical protein Igag_1934 [Ignisphaera aggregans DSM 17230]|uniref:Uncharacterized protein n=1 Tax=Ignisphaera aggregans (strain DSM 17230 / JCM 13409 / AQ1.S1) TaxID=583356 RepID=E0STE1_IGNAA|nr:hypothetical protein Igag_1934 [Ignisphaera aggregans DSM 17230]
MAIVLLITTAIAVMFYITVMIYLWRAEGSVEEEYIEQPKTVSPATKIIALILRKMITSIEAMLVAVSLCIMAIMSSLITSYMYTSTTIDMSGYTNSYNFIGIANNINAIYNIRNIFNTSPLLIVVQLYEPITLRNTSIMLYPLVLYCNPYSSQINSDWIERTCKLLQNGEYMMILNKNIYLNTSSVYINNNTFKIVYSDIGYVTDIAIAPSIPLVHSIGSMGGTILKIENASMITIASIPIDRVESLCRNSCSVKIIALSHLNISNIYEDAKKYLGLFDTVILRLNNHGYVYSNNVIPSPITVIGISIMILSSIIISLSVSGALIEKFVDIGRKLITIGITSEFYSASFIAGLVIFFAFWGIPITVLVSLGIVNTLSILSYIMMSIGNIALFFYVAIPKLERIGKGYSEATLSYITTSSIDLTSLKKCIVTNLESDEFFDLGEVELIEEKGVNIIRIELLYRRAIATLASIEIYIRRFNSTTNLNTIVDVWSLEELSGRVTQGLTQLVLSKMYGVLRTCTESS